LGWEDYLGHGGGATTYSGAKAQTTSTDQLAQIIDKLRNKPTDRRILMSAWNPGELDQMALPPCHMFVQFYLSNDRKLSCQMYQRSVDTFLGLPFNIASYALLTHIIAHTIGADVGTLTICMGDTHIYRDHFEQVRSQLARRPAAVLPRLQINTAAREIDDYKVADFELIGYNPQPAIAAKMSA
jgi:thymidylate synthase